MKSMNKTIKVLGGNVRVKSADLNTDISDVISALEEIHAPKEKSLT